MSPRAAGASLGQGRRRVTWSPSSASTCLASVDTISRCPSGRKPSPEGGDRAAGTVVPELHSGDGVQGLPEHVGEPQHALEPAWPLAETESVGQGVQ